MLSSAWVEDNFIRWHDNYHQQTPMYTDGNYHANVGNCPQPDICINPHKSDDGSNIFSSAFNTKSRVHAARPPYGQRMLLVKSGFIEK